MMNYCNAHLIKRARLTKELQGCDYSGRSPFFRAQHQQLEKSYSAEVPGLKEMVPPEPPTAEEEEAARVKAEEAPSASSGDL